MKNSNTYFYSNGKFLLTGEYLVLEGATALALPVNKGQSLEIFPNQNTRELLWQAKHINGHWFETLLSFPNVEIINTDNQKISEKLVDILKHFKRANSNFLSSNEGLKVETNLEFLPQHGLGSSSTLINNIANWAGVNAYEIQKLTFGGSGYDIACAKNDSPLFYSLEKKNPIVEEVDFKTDFIDSIYFVYLGKKQLSTESIYSFRKEANYSTMDIELISNISKSIVKSNTLEEFERDIEKHEEIMSRVLGRPRVRELIFSDHTGSVKSLGGWGGDFVMMTTKLNEEEFSEYISGKGLSTFYKYKDLII